MKMVTDGGYVLKHKKLSLITDNFRGCMNYFEDIKYEHTEILSYLHKTVLMCIYLTNYHKDNSIL